MHVVDPKILVVLFYCRLRSLLNRSEANRLTLSRRLNNMPLDDALWLKLVGILILILIVAVVVDLLRRKTIILEEFRFLVLVFLDNNGRLSHW